MDFLVSIPTLFIMIIIFILFRVLDKRNRSLEKLKRFSDKTREDLSVFIKDKSGELNEIAVGIDEQLHKGRDILKRILSFEEMLAAKADDFDKMKKTVDSYAATLDELINMSGRVDENLKRLGEESAFVEKMGQKLKETGARVVRLDGELKETEKKFMEQARAELADAESELLKLHTGKINSLDAAVGRMEERTGELESYLKRLEAKKQEAVRQTEGAIGQALKLFEQEIGKKRAQETGGFKNEIEALLAEASQKKDTLQEKMADADSHVAELDQVFSAKIDDFKEQFGQVERMFYTHLESAAKRGEDFEDEVFLNLKKTIDERAHSQEREMERYFGEVQTTLEKRKKEIIDLFGALRSDTNIWHAELKKQMKTQEREIGLQLKNLEDYARNSINGFTVATEKAQRETGEKVEQFISATGARMRQLEEEIKSANEEADRLFKKIDEDSSKAEGSVLASIEKRLDEYEEGVRYRFGKLEAATVDVEALEKSLRETMATTAHKIREDFQALEKDLEAEREEQRARACEELQTLRGEIGDIEAGVTELKEKAYENVSSKMRLAEDGFLDDLRKETEALEERLEKWHEEMETAISDHEVKNEAELEKLAQTYQKQLSKELVALKKTVESDFKALEERANDFEAALDGRIAEKEKMLSTLTDELKSQVEGARTRAVREIESLNAALAKSMEAERRSLEKRANEFERGIDRRIAEKEELVASAAEAVRAEAETLRQKALKDLEAQTAGLSKSMEEDYRALEKRVKDFEKTVIERVAQKESLIAANAETLKREVEAVREKAAAQVEALEETVGKLKQKAADLQKGFLDSFEPRRRELEANLDEMEKRTKAFMAQTKIFERADSLKLGLDADISLMKKEIAKLDAYKKEIADIASDFFSTKKLVEDVSGRMRDFLTEKKRIELIDANFRKLVELSKSIDEKLENATSQHDLLQNLELKFREFDSLVTDVEGRFDRLEGRKKILETTTLSVDKNFEQLGALEKDLKAFERELRGMPKLIGELKKDVEYVNNASEKTGETVARVGKLDDTLADIEARMEKLSVARDWLARTETRLEKVGKQAEEQLKLLETLVRDEVRSAKKDRGAPAMDKRQTVTKLARQGWSPEEIARATKLSRGEVELILELISDKVSRS